MLSCCLLSRHSFFLFYCSYEKWKKQTHLSIPTPGTVESERVAPSASEESEFAAPARRGRGRGRGSSRGIFYFSSFHNNYFLSIIGRGGSRGRGGAKHDFDGGSEMHRGSGSRMVCLVILYGIVFLLLLMYLSLLLVLCIVFFILC